MTSVANHPSRRLSRTDWVDAAAAAISNEGPDAVAVQPLARSLGATKGSFYWHFDSRDDLLRAGLERWAELATEGVIAEVERSVPGKASDVARARAEALFATVTAHSAAHPGELLLLSATAHPDVAEALGRVTERRIGYVTGLLRAGGVPAVAARQRAALAYAAYLGFTMLAHAVPSVLPSAARGRRALAAELAALLLD